MNHLSFKQFLQEDSSIMNEYYQVIDKDERLIDQLLYTTMYESSAHTVACAHIANGTNVQLLKVESDSNHIGKWIKTPISIIEKEVEMDYEKRQEKDRLARLEYIKKQKERDAARAEKAKNQPKKEVIKQTPTEAGKQFDAMTADEKRGIWKRGRND